MIDPPEGIELHRDVFRAALEVVVHIEAVNAHVLGCARHELCEAIGADGAFRGRIERAFLFDQRLEEGAPFKGGEADLAHTCAVLKGQRRLDDALFDPGARLAEQYGRSVGLLGGPCIGAPGMRLIDGACLHGGDNNGWAGDLPCDGLHLRNGFLAFDDEAMRLAQFLELRCVVLGLLRHDPHVLGDPGGVDHWDSACVDAGRCHQECGNRQEG